MTHNGLGDSERFDALQAEIAELRLYNQRREAEHRSVLDAFERITRDRETLRRELEGDYTLLGKAFDGPHSARQERASAATRCWRSCGACWKCSGSTR